MVEPFDSKRKLLNNIPPLLHELWQTAPLLLTIAIVLRIFGAIFPVLALGVGGLLIDAINLAQRSHTIPVVVWYLLAAEALLILGTTALSTLTTHNDLILSDRFILKMNLRLMTKCNELDLETFENAAFQDRLQRARTQISSQVALMKNILQAMQQLIGIIGIMLSAFFVAPGMITVQIIGILPIIIAENHYARIRYSVARKRTPIKRLLEYLLHMVSSAAAAKEIKLFAAGPYIYEEYRSVAEEHNAEDADISSRCTSAILALTTIGTIIYYATYIVLIVRAVSGLYTIGRLFFLASLLQRFRSQLAALLGNISQGVDQLLYIGDIIEFFSEQPSVIIVTRTRPLPQTILKGIEFINVSFTYEGSTTVALKNVSFRIEPGEVVALVGENGAGKSTIVKLITRLYDPSDGQILLDGIDIREFELNDLRGLMTALFQDYVKYDLSASLNIALGEIDSRSDCGRIKLAAQRAGIADAISKLPNQYDQVLGRRFAGGIDLSGGQWQRLALGRAFIRNAAKIVILDEPTATVDARAESLLYEDAIKMASGRMSVLISHHLSNIRHADKILVLKNGSICEEGSHDELIDQGGEYAELFNLQAKGYI